MADVVLLDNSGHNAEMQEQLSEVSQLCIACVHAYHSSALALVGTRVVQWTVPCRAKPDRGHETCRALTGDLSSLAGLHRWCLKKQPGPLFFGSLRSRNSTYNNEHIQD